MAKPNKIPGQIPIISGGVPTNVLALAGHLTSLSVNLNQWVGSAANTVNSLIDTAGTPGPAGKDGTDGKDGKDGAQGPPGTPATPLPSASDGQLLIGNSAAKKLELGTLTAGPGVTITNGGGRITIAAMGSGSGIHSVTTGPGLTSSVTRGVANIDLQIPVTVPHGGTGLTGGTSGGVLYFSAATTLASSGVLHSNGVVLGGGSGATPTAGAKFTFDNTNGPLVDLTTATPASLPTLGAGLNMKGADSSSLSYEGVTWAGSNFLFGWRAQGTGASPAALASGNSIFTFGVGGYDGSAWSGTRSAVVLKAAGAWTGSSHATQIAFTTTPSGATAQANVAAIESDGTLYVGSSVSTTAKNTGAGTVNVDTGYFIGGTNVTPGHLAASQSQSASSFTTTSTAAYVMAGLAGSFTPLFTGRAILMISGVLTSSVGGDGVNVQLSYGTGTAPINGATLTGTQLAEPITISKIPTTVGAVPFSTQALVTGLSVGTAIWIDLAIEAVTGGTAGVTNVSITAFAI